MQQGYITLLWSSVSGFEPFCTHPTALAREMAIAGLVILATAVPNLIYTVVEVVHEAVKSQQYTVPSSYQRWAW